MANPVLSKSGPVALVLAIFLFTPQVQSQTEGDSAVDAMVHRVDHWLDLQMTMQGWQPAGECDDAAFIRRVFLDLTGSPPKASEVLDFIEDIQPQKRSLLVKRLLRSPGHAGHLASIWAGWLVAQEQANPFEERQDGLKNWLRDRFRENLRYDRLIADLLVATGSPQSGPVAFYVSLEGKPEKIAAQTARVFMGVQLDCAECHDHPFDRWKQEDFWGLAAYFAQLTPVGEPGMGGREIYDTNSGDVVLPGTQQVIPAKPLVETSQTSPLLGTRRQQLTLWLTTRENPFLARAAVNRVWALLMGRGLVEPVDDMRDGQVATHPELLMELAEYFANSGYDLQKLMETICLTRAYARDTRHPNGVPPEELYAVMATKPLTERQLATSISEVARQLGASSQQTQELLARQLGKLRGEASQSKVGIVNALVTLHGDILDQASNEASSRLLKALQAPHLDERGKIRWLYLSTLIRVPSVEEEQFLSSFMGTQSSVASDAADNDSESGSSDPAAGGDVPSSDPARSPHWQSDLLWALLNSTEFAMTP